MANLLDFDDNELCSPKSVDSSTTNKSLDEIFAANQSMSQSADLDLLLQAQPSGMLSSTDDLDSLDPFTGARSPTVSMSDDFFAPKPKPKPKVTLDDKKMEDLFGSCPDDDFDFFSSAPPDSVADPPIAQVTPASMDDTFAVEPKMPLDDKKKMDALFGTSEFDLFSTSPSSSVSKPAETQGTPTSVDDFFDSLMKSDTNQSVSQNESCDQVTSQPEPGDKSHDPCDQATSQPEPADKSHDPFADLNFLMQAEPSGIADLVNPVKCSVASPAQCNTSFVNQSPTDTHPDPLEDFLGGDAKLTSATTETADGEQLTTSLEADDTDTTQEASGENEVTVTLTETTPDPLAEIAVTTSEEFSAYEEIATSEADDLELAPEPRSEIEAEPVKSHATASKLTRLSKKSPTDTHPDPLEDFLGGDAKLTSATTETADGEQLTTSLEADDTDTTQEASGENEVTVTLTETTQDPLAEIAVTTSEEFSAYEEIATSEADDLELAPEPRSEIEAEPVKSHATASKLTRLSKKRSMERSFEDLLHGLSEDSDPDLDDMIVSDDNNYSTNLESLLESPDKSIHGFTTPARPSRLEPLFPMEPEADRAWMEPLDVVEDEGQTEVTGIKVEPPEVVVHTPDSGEEDIDIKSWELVDDNIVDEVEEEDGNNSALSDDDRTVEVLMRRDRTSSQTESMDGEDVDFSAVQDTNHLDVDVNKQKSALGKKGSFALRRKPSRKGRRSLVSTGDDAMFQETSEPKSPTMTNGGEDVYTDRKIRDSMSPPAKRPSPATMVPLPGFSQRLSEKEQQMVDDSRNEQPEDEIPVETKRLSRPPPGAFRLPTVEPRAGLAPRLWSTQKPKTEKTTGEKSDVSSGLFTRPSLRSTPKHKLHNEKKEIDQDGALSAFGASLGDTPRRHLDPDSDLDKYDKYSRQNRDAEDDESKHTFEKPVLKMSSTGDKKEFAQSHTFEKPTLRSPMKTNKDSKLEETNTPMGTFDKPSLRKSSSHEKDIKDYIEPKGTFYKPILRKAEVKEDTCNNKSSNSGSFPEMKLRKAQSPEDWKEEMEKEKPSWLQTAVNKTTKAHNIINYKENQRTPVEKTTPSWLEKNQLRKAPLQENNSQSEGDNILKPTTTTTTKRLDRGSSVESNAGSDKDSGTEKTKPAKSHNNYQPSWMRSVKSSQSAVGLGNLMPAKSCPALVDPDEVPQWKKELAQRRQHRRESPAGITDSAKKEDSPEPEWKRNVSLRKLRPTASPSRDVNAIEPEWKKAAEEKRARLRNSVVFDNDDDATTV